MRHMANGQAVAEWFQLLWQLTPLPSPLPPLPIHSGCDLREVHPHMPMVLVRAIVAASQMGLATLDALALLPYSRATLQSLSPFYSLPWFQFRWRPLLSLKSNLRSCDQTCLTVWLLRVWFSSIIHTAKFIMV